MSEQKSAKLRPWLKSLGFHYNFFQLRKLDKLDLRNKNLSVLPDSIGDLKSLRTLCLDNNNLTYLPDSIGNLKNLKILSFSGNPLHHLPKSVLDRCGYWGIHYLSPIQFLGANFNNKEYIVLNPNCLYNLNERSTIDNLPRDELFNNLIELNTTENLIDFYTHFGLNLGEAVTLLGDLTGLDITYCLESLDDRPDINKPIRELSPVELPNNNAYNNLIEFIITEQPDKAPYVTKVLNSCPELYKLINDKELLGHSGVSPAQVITKSNEALKHGIWL